MSDTSLRELHAFAASVGLPERAFEGDHYDVPEERYPRAVAAGAIPVSGRELLRRLRASGLRRAKRRGERVVASRQDLATGQRIDSVLSPLMPLGPVRRVHAVILSAGHLLVLDDDEGFTLPAVEVGGPGGAGVSGAGAVEVGGRVAGPGADVGGRAGGTIHGPGPVRVGGAGERSGPGPSVDPAYRVAGRDLAVALLGRRWAALPVQQVGYLRRVPDGCVLPTGFEVVLRWPDVGPPAGELHPGADGRPRVTAPLRWVPAGRASALLPVDLAPVAMAEHHRLRPDRPEDPATLPLR